ncbi:MAG: hypothetical protein L3J35_01030 [Bacteroidales bacterium]|nr:hypothetical protein [Bacteroidales bacterium]
MILITVSFSYISSAFGQSNQEKTCADCHGDLLKYEYLHPVVEDACDNCHQKKEGDHPNSVGNEFYLTESIPDLCYMCHDPKNTKKNVHPPVTDGYCMMCHSPHGSSNPAMIKKSPNQETCMRCHDFKIPETDKMHAPVKSGDCQNCHDPHQSDNSYFLKETKPQLCFSCHENEKKEASLENIHYPFDDDCGNCHKPHSSSENYLMSEKTPDICFNCHDGFKENFEKSVSSHSVALDQKNCINCHSPHASSYSSMLKNDKKNLCLGCHNKKIKTETRTIENIDRKIKTGVSVHGAIEFDGCATCHKPHFSEYESLLIGKYPRKKYENAEVENFSLCFECHEQDLLEKEKTTNATNFRNGETNMHYLHVKGKKGRSCSLCHDVHASGNEHLIRKVSKFGSWEMQMNYKVTTAGGSCFPGCHAEKSYRR